MLFLGKILRLRMVNIALGSVAQGLEQGTHNPLVVGSKPTGPTNETIYFIYNIFKTAQT